SRSRRVRAPSPRARGREGAMTRSPEPSRWIDDPGRDGPARDLLARVGPAEQLGPEALARIRRRISAGERRRRARKELAFALIAGIVAAAGVSTAATLSGWWSPEPPPSPAPSPPPA